MPAIATLKMVEMLTELLVKLLNIERVAWHGPGMHKLNLPVVSDCQPSENFSF